MTPPTLNLQGSGMATFDAGAWLTIAPNATMTITDTHSLKLYDNLASGGILENWGTIIYWGQAGAATDISMAFLNHGQVFLSGSGANSHALRFSSNATIDGGGVVMDGGAINLSNGAWLDVVHRNYVQSGGTLTVTDNVPATLGASGAAGGVEINGGVVQMTSPMGFGRLKVNSPLAFNGGTYICRINGQQGGTTNSDSIVASAYAVTIGNNATLQINIQGPLAAGQVWTILYATTINQTFQNVNVQNPQQRIVDDPNDLTKKVLQLTS